MDRFGDYGLIGTALVQRHPDDRAAWRLRLFMVSCRATGRDVPVAMLGWLIRRARADGAREMLVDVRPSPANVELRLLLRRAGFAKLASETTGRFAKLASETTASRCERPATGIASTVRSCFPARRRGSGRCAVALARRFI